MRPYHLRVFLVSCYSLRSFWSLLIWVLLIGRAGLMIWIQSKLKHFNVGGWSTHGDYVVDVEVDFLGEVEDRLR